MHDRLEELGYRAGESTIRFRTFRAHYAFRADFCNPGASNEKGLAENLVGYIRRNVLVPVPRVKDWSELQAALLHRCRKYQDHRIAGRSGNVGEYLAIEQASLTPLPGRPFETALVTEAKVYPDGMVGHDCKTAYVLTHDHVSPGVKRITLRAPEIAAVATPGQFVNVKCSPTMDPLLRRPFSLNRYKPRRGHYWPAVQGCGTRH